MSNRPDSKDQTGKGKTVAVTGCSGYIAGNLVKQLLAKGYSVRGTVRSLNNEDKVKHLREDYPGVELYEADLLKDGSFKDCFAGCDYVFHTASPFLQEFKDPMKDLVEPALKGTINVVTEALNSASVKKIILTSSVAAVRSMTNHHGPDYVYTEKDFNDTATVENGAYPYSKVVAEKKAWELVRAHPSGKKLLVICPSFVLGPPVSTRTDSVSVGFMVKLLNGTWKDGIPAFQFGCVDVDDVARAHVLAAERNDADGRYIASSNQAYTRLQLANIVRQQCPEFAPVLPTTMIKPESINAAIKIDHTKGSNLIGGFTPLEDTIKRMVHFLVDNGLAHKPNQA